MPNDLRELKVDVTCKCGEIYSTGTRAYIKGWFSTERIDGVESRTFGSMCPSCKCVNHVDAELVTPQSHCIPGNRSAPKPIHRNKHNGQLRANRFRPGKYLDHHGIEIVKEANSKFDEYRNKQWLDLAEKHNVDVSMVEEYCNSFSKITFEEWLNEKNNQGSSEQQ